MVGDTERGVPELGGPFHEPDRVRRPVEEAEVGMGVKLRVPCHSTTLIEHMFDVFSFYLASSRRSEPVFDISCS